MDPEIIHKALQGQENILTTANERFKDKFGSFSCPECGGKVIPVLDPSKPLFNPNEVIPNYSAKCTSCLTISSF